jgi:hypothetical protein
MAKRAIYPGLLLLACNLDMAGPTDELPISLECAEPIVETFAHTAGEVHVSRKHCIDKMGPDANGLYEFYYEYDLYEFSQGSETLHARSYTSEPEEAHVLGIESGGQRGLLAESDLAKALVRAALEYLRTTGKTKLTWLDPSNEVNGYSPIP